MTHHAPELPEKIAGVPAPAFLAMLAVGVGYALYKRRQNAAAAAAATPASDTLPADTSGTAPSSLGVTAGITSDGSYSTGTSAPTTNQQWQIQAETQLIARGYAPLLVDKALGDYFMGNALPADEQAVITLALQTMGPPPEGAPVVNLVPVAPTPPPVVSPTPTGSHVPTGTTWGYAGAAGHPVVGSSGGGGTTNVPARYAW